ncbi:maltose/maltodextrin ABC transporter [Klebsiella pneumoniae]|uniref:Maltose/maltodextrin transport system permease protein MalG n=1 Tax=Klebsiella pneumoniae TaxID=573 RepID=A0A377TJB1_KLEPN|nr:maltose/maltodextrin ABC transporter [Klebsiella pneumoniae]
MGRIALHVWTIKGYFETIDGSLEEAAALDGATPWQAFRLVLLPLSCRFWQIGVYSVVHRGITEVPVASLLLRDVNSLYPGGRYATVSQPAELSVGRLAAAAVLSAIPITVVFLLAQRWLVNGLTAGE